jgi:hypothetical protein
MTNACKKHLKKSSPLVSYHDTSYLYFIGTSEIVWFKLSTTALQYLYMLGSRKIVVI